VSTFSISPESGVEFLQGQLNYLPLHK